MTKRRRHYTKPLIPRWLGILALTPVYTLAAPVAGQFIAGSGSIKQNGTTTTITQTSQQASLNWQGFNIAPNETVRFLQPSASAIAVNRIFDTNGSQLLGQLQANGQVWLINPNGVLFGVGSQVNVGALVASTLDFNDSSLFSSTRSFSGNGKGSIVNQGSITTAPGGFVAMLANQVSNQGSITAQLGTVALGAGNAITLSFNGNSLVRMQVDQSVLNSLAKNGGLIRADGGLVLMSAGARDSLLASVVNNSGIIEARTVTEQAGGIVLLGGMQAGSVQVSGTLNASAPNGGNGGHIETSAALVQITDAAHITTAAPKGKFGSWLIDPQNFTVAASSSDYNAPALSAAMELNSIELQSSHGAATGSGNININAAISWNANSSLTLTASNNVNVNANITATGNTAGLIINPNTANGGEAANGNGFFNLHSGAAITLSGSNPSLSIAGQSYIVINGLAALQNMNADTNWHYALGSNINAADTVNWNGGRGFTPIGSAGSLFTGTLEGLGHSVNNLAINQLTVGAVTPNVGLIGSAGDGSVVTNIGVVDGNIKGGAGTGGIVGSNLTGSISNSYFTGTITGGAGTGSLVGSTISGAIFNSYAVGDISGAAGTGGLVGSSTSGNISQSYHTGNVSGAAGTGGLVGSSTSGNISQSYHTGNVSGAAGTGGLVGSVTSGSIANSYSIGTVAGQAGAGGLAGSVTSGTVSTSFAVGAVTGAAGTGGLLGATSGPVAFSYWDTTVGPATSVGGGAGLTSAQMRNQSNFVGFDFNTIWGSFSGGIPGLSSLMTEIIVTANSISKTYNGVAFAGGNGVSFSALPGGALPTGLTFSGASQGAVNASGTSYAITPGGLVSSQAIHYTFVDGSLTILPLAVNLTGSRAYDGSVNMLASAMSIGGLIGSDTLSLSGVGTLTNKNAGSGKSMSIGSLALGNGGTGLASNYLISGSAMNADIAQAAITLASSAVTKTYDGGLTAAGTAVVTNGSLMSGDSLSGGSFAFTDKNVGSANKTVTASGVTVGDGTHNNNYSVSYADNVASTINALGITLSSSSVTKTYDGGLTAAGSAVVTSGSLMTGDSLSGGSFAFTDKNAGSTNKTVTASGVTVGDGTHNNNYTVLYADNTVSTINAASLTLSTNAVTKIYDGGLTASGSAIVTSGSLMTGDTLSGGSFAFTDKNVGSTNKTVTTSSVTVGDGTHNNNYSVSYADNVASTINAASITLASSAVTKTYDGGLTAAGSAVVTNGSLMSGDSLSGGSFAFTDKNVGSTNKTVTASGVTVGDGTHNNNYTVLYADNTVSTINAASLTLSTNAVTKIYDGGLTASGSAIVTSGSLMTGDTLSGGSFAFTDKNVGSTNKTVSTSGVTVGDGTHNNNYNVVYADNAASTINAAAITLASNAVTKTYDGGLTAAGSAVVVSGSLMTGDTLSGGSFAFTDKNVGSANKTVTTGGVTVGDGTHNNNYSVSYADNTASTINALGITLASSAVTKTYDGGLTAAGTAVVTNGSLMNGDTLTGGSFAFTDKNVGVGTKTVSISGVTVGDGVHNANYAVVYADNTASTINAASITLSNSEVTKTYDGGLTASGSAVVVSGSLMRGDSLSGGSFAFTDKNVGDDTKTVITKAVTVGDGVHNNNYTVSYVDNTVNTINPAAITLASNSVTKTYDGGLNAAGSAVVTSGSLMSGDSLTGGSFAFTDKNVGAGTKVVSTSGVNVGDGVHNSNYAVVYADNTASTITAAALTLSTNAVSKTYDGGLTAAGSAVVTNGSLMSGDTLNGGNFAFTDKNVGTANKTVSTSSVTVGDGIHNNNYTVLYADNTVSTINAASLTLSTNAVTKIYDGGLTASGSAIVTSGSLMTGDTLSGGSFAFTDKNVGSTNKTVTTSSVTVGDGTQNNNYSVSYADNVASTINAASITLASNAVTKTYDGGLTAAGSAIVTNGSLMSGDNLSGGSFAFTDKNVGSTNKTVTASGVTVGDGTHNNNYTVLYADNTVSTINALGITLSSSSVTKTYDGGLTAAGSAVVTNGSLMLGDTLSGGSFAFTDKNVGSANKTVTTSNVTVGDGTHNNNYNISYADNVASTINAASITLASSAVTKTYDGGLTAAGTAVVTNGSLMSGDSLSGGSFAFADKNVGSTNKTVTASGVTVGDGTHNSNYNVVYADNVASTINALGITLASSAVTKTYDGGLTAAGSAVVTNGSLMSGDSLSGGSFAFTDKNVGSANKTVSASGVTVGDGTHNNNYSVSYADNVASTINAASITLASSAVTKTYDGGLTAAGSAVVTNGSLMSGDNLSGGSFAFTDKNVGSTNKTVTASGVTVGDGTHNNNYNVVYADNVTSTINAASITLASNAVSKIYDGGLTAAGSAVVTNGSLMSGDTLSGGSFAFTDKNVGSANKTVSTSGVTVGDGTHNSNYNVVYADNVASTINALGITLASSAVTKTYDGGLTAASSAVVTSGSLMNGDSLSGGSFAFTDKNVGSANKTVTASGVTVGDGTHNNNYNIVYANNNASTINVANLVLTDVSVHNKIADGTTSATLGGTAEVEALGLDVITVGGIGVGSFADALVGNAKPVTITGFTLIGTNAGNYHLVQPFGLTANITADNANIPVTPSNTPAPITQALSSMSPTIFLAEQSVHNENKKNLITTQVAHTACSGEFFTPAQDGAILAMGPTTSLTNCGINLPVSIVSDP